MTTMTCRPLLATLLALAACAGPQGEAAERRPPADCRMDVTAIVPLEGLRGVVAVAELNGQPLRMALSTGQAVTSLLPATAQELALSEDPRRRSAFASSGGDLARQNVRVHALRLGTQDWGERSLAVRPVFLNGAVPADKGTLGMDLIRDLEFELDLPGRRAGLTAARGCQPVPPPWTGLTSVPMEMVDNLPTVPAQLGGQSVRALVHSGSVGIFMTRALLERLDPAVARPTGRTGRSYGTDPTADPIREYRLRELTVGSEVLRDVEVQVVQRASHQAELVLGQSWLERRKVWFSFGTRRLYMAATAN